MQKLLLLFAVSFFILSCNSESTTQESTTSTDEQSTTVETKPEIGRTNYAVIWDWTTTKPELVKEHLPTISKELTGLWEKDAIENAYFDTKAKSDKLGDFANVVFFLKAQTEADASAILDNLTIVKQGIASYTLRPVGVLWLDRKADVINKNAVTRSYAAVWKTQGNEPEGEILKQQGEKVMELWKAGTIENVYFDIEGTQEANANTDFVFFVNANTQKEAEAICNMLPLAQNKLATYQLFPVGVFWMGKHTGK